MTHVTHFVFLVVGPIFFNQMKNWTKTREKYEPLTSRGGGAYQELNGSTTKITLIFMCVFPYLVLAASLILATEIFLVISHLTLSYINKKNTQ